MQQVSPELGQADQADAAQSGCGVAQWDGQEEKGIGFVTSLGPTGPSRCFRVMQKVPRGSEITVPALAPAS